MNDALRKLRIVAITAYAKIVANARKDDPAKWPKEAVDSQNRRSWLRCSPEFLYDKIAEETCELINASDEGEPLPDILKEAGDVTAVAMFIADKSGCFQIPALVQPKVVCLCGSTRFKQEFIDANFEETMKGHIVLSVGFFSHADKDKYEVSEQEKKMLDDLHKRKIDLADEILVINVDNYIDESTRSEIEYAQQTGKEVRYLYPNVGTAA